MYHFLNTNMMAAKGLESPWQVGETRAITTKPIMWKRGYHASPTPYDALQYALGPVLCEVTLGGTILTYSDKSVAQSRTLIAAIDVTPELGAWVCDCAERVLYIFEVRNPNDNRPRKALEMARKCLIGYALRKELSIATARAADAARAAADVDALNWAYNPTYWARNFADYDVTGADAAAAARAAASASSRAAGYVSGSYDSAKVIADAAADAARAADRAGDPMERVWQQDRLTALVLPKLAQATKEQAADAR